MRTCWWSRAPAPGNLGDVLTPIILRRMGIPVQWERREHADMLAIGSIIRFARPKQLVWGSGCMFETNEPHPRAVYLAVRGPHTRSAVLRAGGTCPEVYGDPAMLLPHVYNRKVSVKYDVGLVPHYVDVEDPQVKRFDGPVIHPLRANPLEVVDEIRSCRAVLSSSLHGIIVAHAYGIPAAWVRLSDKLNGDDVKFRDHAASCGVELVPYERVEDAVPVLGSFDDGPLVDSFEVLRAVA